MTIKALALPLWWIAGAGNAQQAPAPTRAANQAPIPIRQVASPSAKTWDALGNVAGLRQLPDGRVLINDAVRGRLLVFDPTLSRYTISADSAGAGLRKYPLTTGGRLYEYLGDSTLIADAASRTFLVIDPHGEVARAMAPIRAVDFANMTQAYWGAAGFDAKGRFIYRGGQTVRLDALRNPGPPTTAPVVDTIALVRADFDTRIADTVARLAFPRGVPPVAYSTTPDGKRTGVLRINPVPGAPDEWAVLSDGSLAVVRTHDYHIDWLYADGSRASTPKMPFDWRRLTDQDKQAKVDSMRRIIDSVSAAGRPFGMTVREVADSNRGNAVRVDTMIPSIAFVPFAEMLDYVPAVRAGATKPDRDGHLWILPTTSLQARNGLLYDVVDRKGEIVERVQLPMGRAIAGFGPHGVVYLQWRDGTNGLHVEKTQVVR